MRLKATAKRKLNQMLSSTGAIPCFLQRIESLTHVNIRLHKSFMRFTEQTTQHLAAYKKEDEEEAIEDFNMCLEVYNSLRTGLREGDMEAAMAMKAVLQVKRLESMAASEALYAETYFDEE